MRDIYIVVETRVILRSSSTASPEAVAERFVTEMDYKFVSKTTDSKVIDTKIRNFHITKMEDVPEQP